MLSPKLRMPQLQTKYFGPVTCDPDELFQFPAGLPAFEEEKSFAPLDLPGTEPLLFLQSTSRPELCFLCFPILVVDPSYKLSVAAEDLDLLELGRDRQPRIGADVLVLAFLSIQDNQPATANLMAPVVVNPKNRRGVQAIRCDAVYSHQHAIPGLSKEGVAKEQRC